MGFFYNINNNVIVNAIKQKVKRRNFEESESDSVQGGTPRNGRHVLNTVKQNR